jgi:hypothetical protein
MKRFTLAIAVMALVLMSSAVRAGIVGSAHDFSGSTWSGGEICRPCHTPHGATVKDSLGNDIGAPIWNRNLPSSTSYKMYINGVATANQEVDSNSILCLSCHDGTIALDSFGGASGTTFIGSGTGANPKANLGTDLTTDHPIGAAAVWPTPNPSYMVDPSLRDAKHIMPLRTMSSSGKLAVGCSSCHEPHNRSGAEHLLWVSNIGATTTVDSRNVPGSGLCLNCHKK